MATRPPHRIEFHGSIDEDGRESFTLFWMADYHPGHPDGEHGWRERGQCFFALVPSNLTMLAAVANSKMRCSGSTLKSRPFLGRRRRRFSPT